MSTLPPRHACRRRSQRAAARQNDQTAAWTATKAPLFNVALSARRPQSCPAAFERLAEERVNSTTIDDAISRYVARPAGRVVLKIDVEGAEIKALRGASRTLAGDAAVIYEDHGRDAARAISSDLLERGVELFALARDGTPIHLRNVASVAELKTSPNRGYNFLASRPGTASYFVLRRVSVDGA